MKVGIETVCNWLNGATVEANIADGKIWLRIQHPPSEGFLQLELGADMQDALAEVINIELENALHRLREIRNPTMN
jgi:hypothetical protein